MDSRTRTTCHFLPPYLLQHLAEAGVGCAEQTLVTDRALRAARSPGALVPAAPAATGAWVVHTAGNTTDLPGTPAHTPGQPATGDPAVDEAAEGIEATLAMFREVWERDSFGGKGATVSATVHYGTDYVNAFWDGTQLVFGDGDGELFTRFTAAVDVLAHEFSHAVVERTAGLVYSGQSGALNESVSDVFASCLRQRVLGQDAAGADWLIGQGIFAPGVQGRALRDMAAPGTAYDDPRLGKDPQVGSMADYVETTEDNGGVHLNSGIPNRAFQLAAVAIGGDTAAGAGTVWYRALTSGAVRPDTDFGGFAAATIAAAGEHTDAVAAAWAEVGVEPGAVVAPGVGDDTGNETGPGSRLLTVRRTGGFAGITTTSTLDLGSDRASDARALLARVVEAGAWREVAPDRARPDTFTYEVRVEGRAPIRLAEHSLQGPLADLVRAVMEQGDSDAR